MSVDEAQGRIPRLARGVRLREDAARGGWVLLAPERVFRLDQPGQAILELVDGKRSEAHIVDELAQRFAAERALIAQDVATYFDGYAERRVIEFD